MYEYSLLPSNNVALRTSVYEYLLLQDNFQGIFIIMYSCAHVCGLFIFLCITVQGVNKCGLGSGFVFV